MSYDTVKNCITAILQGLGYTESIVLKIENMPTSEYGTSFILKRVKGEMAPDGETIVDKFYDDQEWNILIALDNNYQNDRIAYDEANRKVDTIITALDKPENWTDSVVIQKYKSWEITPTDNYSVLDIKIQTIDRYVY
jgi:hypothetical protein